MLRTRRIDSKNQHWWKSLFIASNCHERSVTLTEISSINLPRTELQLAFVCPGNSYANENSEIQHLEALHGFFGTGSGTLLIRVFFQPRTAAQRLLGTVRCSAQAAHSYLAVYFLIFIINKRIKMVITQALISPPPTLFPPESLGTRLATTLSFARVMWKMQT